jgi:hypothetical protein
MEDGIQAGRQLRDVEKIALEKMDVGSFEEPDPAGIPDKGENLGVVGPEVFDEMAPDKARAAGDQDFHDRRFIL